MLKQLLITTALLSPFASSASTFTNIETCQQLVDIPHASKDSYRLVNDLDCAGVSFERKSTFRGQLDGNHKTIRNIDLTYSNPNVFGKLDDAKIYNLTLSDVNLNFPTDGRNTPSNLGVLAGGVFDSELSNIRLDNANVTGRASQSAGLLLGWVTRSTFNNVAVVNSTLTTISRKIGGVFGNLIDSDVNYVSVENNQVYVDNTRTSIAYFGHVAGYATESNLTDINVRNNYADVAKVKSQFKTAVLFGGAYQNISLGNVQIFNTDINYPTAYLITPFVKSSKSLVNISQLEHDSTLDLTEDKYMNLIHIE